MTDELAFLDGTATTEPTHTGAKGRTCRRHHWAFDGTARRCARCGREWDADKARAGKRNRRLGCDTERRLERIYGPEKIGELNGVVDLRGSMFKYQSKASRRRPPKEWVGIVARLEEVADGRTPVIVLTYVVEGVGTWDFFVIPGAQPHRVNHWLSLHGRDEQNGGNHEDR